MDWNRSVKPSRQEHFLPTRSATTCSLVCASLLPVSMLRPGTSGMRFAIDRTGMSFKLDMAFVKIAFDIGQSCSKTDNGRNLMG